MPLSLPRPDMEDRRVRLEMMMVDMMAMIKSMQANTSNVSPSQPSISTNTPSQPPLDFATPDNDDIDLADKGDGV
ncbi:UNVERIFIED_CONTAM: hypothetical protein Sradi_4909600 [Sesamum radiatum]|uniref:Uncharacterized protein n=1 Tax=Sesamum radiatum TaxID=300843 RepID=A0AAW2MED8_SESRA